MITKICKGIILKRKMFLFSYISWLFKNTMYLYLQAKIIIELNKSVLNIKFKFRSITNESVCLARSIHI